ncbi:CBO0543 family protein [Guptibacillus hwajinpoensis]|uniref:CBO0543 family protein n=1 Tax=Guptibacillus hwajinpoensis TaxID=208199 RepID=UPI003D6B7DE0
MEFEKFLLWILFSSGVGLFLYNLSRPHAKEWLLIFLLTGYCASILGTLVVEEKMLSYPSNIFHHFDSSVTYEYVLFPLISVYYYRSTYRLGLGGILLRGAVYSGGITIIEYFLERYTDLIHYYTWTWGYTFISTFFLLLFVRGIVQLFRDINWHASS